MENVSSHGRTESENLWLDNVANIRGNPKCFLCRTIHILPFTRCKYCDLTHIGQCPTVKAGVFLLAMTTGAGIAACMVEGWLARTILVVMGLVAMAFLLHINSYSNEKQRNRLRLAHMHKELDEQHDFLKELSPLNTLEDCLDHIVKNASTRLKCHRVSIMIPDENQEYLHIAAACGLPEEVIKKTRIPIGEYVAGRVFQNNGPIHISNTDTSDWSSRLPIASHSFMSAPLLFSGMRWGVSRLGVFSVTDPIGRTDFSIDDEFVFSNICEASAVAIFNHMALAKIKQGNVEFLETMVNAIEAKDRYTRGHSDRVSKYALAMGRSLALRDETLQQLQMTARLHDIGKIGVPDAVLLKPGRLNQEEWQAIQRHTDIGAKMLAQASIVSSTIDAIRGHHERLDGSGYHGLTRPEIPIMARVIAVADAFDAMTTPRPYREPLGIEEALSELERCRNQQFDSACVDALIDCLNAGEFDEWLSAKHQRSVSR